MDTGGYDEIDVAPKKEDLEAVQIIHSEIEKDFENSQNSFYYVQESLKELNEFADKVEDYHAMAQEQLTRIKNAHFDEL